MEELVIQDPLLITIDDDELDRVIDVRKEYAESKYKEIDLKNRQNKNLDYLLGKHDANDDRKLKDYQARYMDNVIYESEAYIKPIALSRLPDLLVKANSSENEQVADDITEIINSEIRKRENRKVINVAHRHLPIFFIGAVKYRWDPTKGSNGDYKFEFVHPQDLVLDWVPSNNPDDMGFIIHVNRMTLKEAIIRWPRKKDALLKAVFGTNTQAQEVSRQKGYATRIDIEEIWFSWLSDEEKEPRREEFCLWRYKGSSSVILAKTKNPNYDYAGHIEFVTTDENGNERMLNQQELMELAFGMSSISVQPKRVYRNYHEQPRKPFIFINYDWLGDMPVDNTSRIEQVLLLQDNIDIRGRQITDIANTSRGKDIYSAESGMTKSDVERIDPLNPRQNLFVKEDIDKSFRHIPSEQPSPALFQEQDINRNRIFAKMGVNSTTRGQIETDTATTAQIARETDFGRIDDLVEDTINYLAEEMARAAMHMIKLRYTQEHIVKIVGKNGKITYKTISSDMIDDGMEVTVFASGTDKVMRKREAYERAGMNLTDPLTFFEDTEASDPKGRTKRLLLYLSNPAQYLMEEVEEKSVPSMANELIQQSAQEQDMGGQEALMAIAQLQQGKQPALPQQVTPVYLDTLNNFLNSPEFIQLPPEVQQMIGQFAQEVMNMSQQMPQQQMSPQQGMQQQAMSSGMVAQLAGGGMNAV